MQTNQALINKYYDLYDSTLLHSTINLQFLAQRYLLSTL